MRDRKRANNANAADDGTPAPGKTEHCARGVHDDALVLGGHDANSCDLVDEGASCRAHDQAIAPLQTSGLREHCVPMSGEYAVVAAARHHTAAEVPGASLQFNGGCALDDWEPLTQLGD